ncbi:MAG TPA: NUDIX domain-containing protein [Symbiobacteriaceae bacterium]|nr:NUDIX domain-containing protein [Symbiobacteriaceae bacterium]
MTVTYAESYEGHLRQHVGARKLILPSVRAIISDAEGRVLLVRRDDGIWGMPAGGLELDEAPGDALRREVREETGLAVQSATLMAVDSFSTTNPYGNEAHRLVFVFRVDRWSGELQTVTDETRDARFVAPDELPDLPELYRQTLEDFRSFTGQTLLKPHRLIR